MSYWKMLLRWIISYISPEKVCLHVNFDPLSPFDHFCPDCGKRVVAEWHIIRCDVCDTKRNGFYLMDRFVPYMKYCKRCGSDEYKLEIKENINFFDYSYAAFKIKAPHNPYNSKENTSKTKVWVDNCSNPLNNQYEKIKAKNKLLPATIV